MFGRALEALCRDHLLDKHITDPTAKKKTIMLGQGIKQLRDKNVIDDRLYDWSQQLQAFRNLAAHPDDDFAPSRQDTEDLLDGVGDLHQLACGGFRIGEGTGINVFDHSVFSSGQSDRRNCEIVVAIMVQRKRPRTRTNPEASTAGWGHGRRKAPAAGSRYSRTIGTTSDQNGYVPARRQSCVILQSARTFL